MNSKTDTSQLVEKGREVLRTEADAIARMSQSLDSSFADAVSLIEHMSPTGRVVVSGMGKAGIIGSKISATLSSTGTPSFFLHPAEAVHGDLGKYTQSDVALLLSNSGETEEVLRTLPFVKRIGCKTIAITGSRKSTLGSHCDVVIEIGDIVEACPLGLAPTTSTSVLLAIGDALAMTVLELRDFTREEYARYHPAGSLGRALMLVEEVMRTEDRHCIVPDSYTVREVVRAIASTKDRPGAAAIVSKDKKLAGIFTDGDLRRLLGEDDSILSKPVAEVMTTSPKVIHPDQLVQEALRIMTEKQIDQLVVIDAERKPVGLIDIQDIVILRSR